MKTLIEKKTIDGNKYNVFEIKTKRQTGIVTEYIPTEEDIKKQIDLNRTEELRQLIHDMQLLGDDVTVLQDEFRTLTGL